MKSFLKNSRLPRLPRVRLLPSSHDRHWHAHPAVPTGDALTVGQRAADQMKAVFSTWTALLLILFFMLCWLSSGGFGHDGPPFILLNLCLSCLAALQCFILLIAAKRADQIAAAIALHTLQNTEAIKDLIEQNTALTQHTTALMEQNTTLTEQVAELTRAIHDHFTSEPRPSPAPAPAKPAKLHPKSNPKARVRHA